jgi:hypothetical protein
MQVESCCGKIAKVIPVIVVYIMISIVYYVFLVYYVLDLGNNYDFQMLSKQIQMISTKKVIHLFIGSFFLFLMILCHFLSICTNPGNVNFDKLIESEKKMYKVLSLSSASVDEENEFIPSKINQIKEKLFCEKCNKRRPHRAHHCSSCNTCILKMDHHCPWIANCVGLNNQKYFYLFLFYSFISCIIFFLGLVIKFITMEKAIEVLYEESSLLEEEFNNNVNSTMNDTKSIQSYSNQHNETFLKLSQDNILNGAIGSQSLEQFFVFFPTSLTVLLGIGISILFIIHSFLIFNDMTTIECNRYKIKEQSPYYNPMKWHNFKIVMGDNFLKWFIPNKVESRNNDGYNYITRYIPERHIEHIIENNVY